MAFAACSSVALLGAGIGEARAANTMKPGFALDKNTPYDTFAEVFAKEVKKATKGSVKVKNFCCFKMGGEQEMFKKLQLGTLDTAIIARNNARPFDLKIDLLVLPCILQNYEYALKLVDGPLGQSIWKDMPKETGVHLVKITLVSFRHIYNTKAVVNTNDDFKPLKYRVRKNGVMVDTLMVDTHKAFGSDPVPLAWSGNATMRLLVVRLSPLLARLAARFRRAI